MTWPPRETPPCPPDCTCNALGTGEPWTPLDRAMHWPDVPAEPVTRQWVEDTDPAPVEPPPEPGHEKARPLNRVPGGVSDQPTSPFGFTEFGQHTPPPSIIRRILNATRRNT